MTKALVDEMYRITREGARCRADGGTNPYPPNSVQSFLHSGGWLQEDLRLALIEAKPSYARSQAGRGRWFDLPHGAEVVVPNNAPHRDDFPA